MGKFKQKNHSELEYLRGQNKKLQSEVKRLKRQLRETEKQTLVTQMITDLEDEIIETSVVGEGCSFCGKGILNEISLGRFTFVKCNTCDFKQRKKQHEQKNS